MGNDARTRIISKHDVAKKHLYFDAKVMKKYNQLNEQKLITLVNLRNSAFSLLPLLYPEEFLQFMRGYNPQEVKFSEQPFDNLIELITNINRSKEYIVEVIERILGDARLDVGTMAGFVVNARLKAVWGLKFYKQVLRPKLIKDGNSFFCEILDGINKLVNEILIFKYQTVINEVINQYMEQRPPEMTADQLVSGVIQEFLYIFYKIRLYGKVSQTFIRNHLSAMTLKMLNDYIYFKMTSTDIGKYFGREGTPDPKIRQAIENKTYLSERAYKHQPKGDERDITYEQLLEDPRPLGQNAVEHKQTEEFILQQLEQLNQKFNGYFETQCIDLLKQIVSTQDLNHYRQLLEKFQVKFQLTSHSFRDAVRSIIQQIISNNV